MGTPRRDIELLEQLGTDDVVTPYPGAWLTLPVAHGDTLVLAEDAGLSRLVLRVSSGHVELADGATGTQVVATSLERFVSCARAYTHALHEAAVLEDPDDEQGLVRLEEQLLRTFRGLDPALALSEDHFWASAAEANELGVMAFPKPRHYDPQPQSEATAETPRIVVAIADEERESAFTAQEWQHLASLAPVTVVRAPHRLVLSLQAHAEVAEARGQASPRSSVLLVSMRDLPDAASLEFLRGLELVCVLGEEPDPQWAPPGPALRYAKSARAVLDLVAGHLSSRDAETPVSRPAGRGPR